MRTSENLLSLLLFVSLLFGFLVPSIHGRQGDAFRTFMKIKANGGVYTDHDLTIDLPDFKPEFFPQEGSKESDKISQLPGQPSDVILNHYGGYIIVNQNVGRSLYYYFVEAETDKDSKPLIIWFNGGPGCSSVGFGAFEELGPLLVKNDYLIKNPYAWNKLGSMLFYDSPAGVGFSYSNDTWDYTSTGDMRTIEEAYNFLINWLERFPEYKNRDVYIAGESYAGHYVPEIAYTILQQNKKGGTIINLKGISIGNPTINDQDERGLQKIDRSPGWFEYLWRNNLMSDEDWNKMQKSCDFNMPFSDRTLECKQVMLLNFFRFEDNTYPYNIYGPKCHEDNTTVTSGPVGADDACKQKNLVVYFTRPEVIKALHAKVTRFDEGYESPNKNGTVSIIGKWDKWEGCRDVFLHRWEDSPISVLPILEHLHLHGIPILVYSGDFDAVLPYTCARDAIKRLQLPVQRNWTLWGNKEISGSIIKYQGNLTLATVRGAGHEVPRDQPRRAFELIQSFIEGKRLPITKTEKNLTSMGITQDDDDSDNGN
ncbi:serine carboxypeptidase-like 26 [Macadamia integrifolia]|uniref:serine carboxypeptidase-like 26 n=1 Tax=Macadamia integrifolia TaxID=60698 RepID=UPI001C4FAE1F|nr:serine carboxypeptidase-like 26 [Macadamia integrifolia]